MDPVMAWADRCFAENDKRKGMKEVTEYNALTGEVTKIVHDAAAQNAAVDTRNPKDRLGMAKPGFTVIPPSALLHLGRAMADGARKYGLMNWREKEVLASVYINAGMRHKLSWWDGEDVASDSLVHHLAHDMACNAILLDALETGKLVDDRPFKGNLPDLIAKYTVKNG